MKLGIQPAQFFVPHDSVKMMRAPVEWKLRPQITGVPPCTVFITLEKYDRIVGTVAFDDESPGGDGVRRRQEDRHADVRLIASDIARWVGAMRGAPWAWAAAGFVFELRPFD